MFGIPTLRAVREENAKQHQHKETGGLPYMATERQELYAMKCKSSLPRRSSAYHSSCHITMVNVKADADCYKAY